jgi:septal ring factor EnvC (AmiA/AmiB activator)
MSAAKLSAALLLVVSGPVMAQEIGADSATPAVQGYAPAGAPAPGPVASVPVPPLLIVGAIALPHRSEAYLEQSLSAAENDLQRADARLSRASGSRARVESLARQRQSELRELEAKIRQADKEKRKDEKRLLEAQKRLWERQKEPAKRLGTITDAEFEAARTARLVSMAKQQALELELQLAQKRNRPGGSSAVIRELEQQTLEAQKSYRKLEHELARQEEQLANQRLDLYRASLEGSGSDH